MAILESDYQWIYSTAASTGASTTAFDSRGMSQSLSFYIETGPGCTATINIQSRVGTSTGPYATLSTTSLSTGAVSLVQFLGPMGWVRPYVTSKSTGDLSIRLLGN